MLHASEQDIRDAELVGRGGVRGLLGGETDKMVSLRPLESRGETGYEFVSLDRVAEVERPLPSEWISDGAIPVKDRFFQYLEPLMGDLMPYCAPFAE